MSLCYRKGTSGKSSKLGGRQRRRHHAGTGGSPFGHWPRFAAVGTANYWKHFGTVRANCLRLENIEAGAASVANPKKAENGRFFAGRTGGARPSREACHFFQKTRPEQTPPTFEPNKN